MANSDHGNAVPNGQQKHQNVPAGYVKVMAAVIDYALWRLSNGVYKPMDFDIDNGNGDEIFSSTVAHICKHNKQFLKQNTIFLKHNTELSKHHTKLSKHYTKLSNTTQSH